MNRFYDDEKWFGAVYQGVDYGWRFEVSNLGRVRNAKTKRVYSFGYDGSGYLQVCVSVYGRRINVHVHRCVAETMLPNPMGFEIVNHIDGCKQHNDVWNLEWCSRRQNYSHAVDTELIDYSIPAQLGRNSYLGVYSGSCNGRAKLKEEDIRYIRKAYRPKRRGQQSNRMALAERYGVSPNLISKIVCGAIWRHV